MNNYTDQLVELSMNPRTIMFRGKRKDNGEWVYGACLAPNKRYQDDVPPVFIVSLKWNKHYCILIKSLTACKRSYAGLKEDIYEVIPETVGQYTNHKELNFGAQKRNGIQPKGRKIFEGDILKTPTDELHIVINMSDSWHTKCVKLSDESVPRFNWPLCHAIDNGGEIVGNIHDNPKMVDMYLKAANKKPQNYEDIEDR